MAITQSVVSVGTSAVTVVGPTHDYATYVLKNLQPKNVDEYARDGFIYMLSQSFSITSGGTVSFSMATGASGAQLDFYSIITDTATVLSSLIEGATITTNGAAINAYNLNRNISDAHEAVLKSATSITGGSAVSQEFTTASIHAGGELSSLKVHTLRANSNYGMQFVNQGNQTTKVFFQLGFSEQYNGYNSVWLSTVDNSFVIRPGEELKMTLEPNATINATAKHSGCKLAIMRQE